MFISARQLFLYILVFINHSQVFSRGFTYEFFNQTKQVNKVASNECQTTDGMHGICKPTAYCFNQYDSLLLVHKNLCLRNGKESHPGVCCPRYGLEREPTLKKISIRIPQIKTRFNFKRRIDQDILNLAIEAAKKDVDSHLSYEKELIKSGIHQHNNTQESFHQGFFGPYNSQKKELTRNGEIILETSRHLAKLLELAPDKVREYLSQYCLKGTALHQKCLKEPKCDLNYMYRTIDGNCNNQQNPLWGRAMTQLVRLLPSSYSDGIDGFRKSVTGTDLPNARYLSSTLTSNEEINHQHLSVLFVQFGQFLDHDMTLGLNTRADTGEGLSCCAQKDGAYVEHKACAPIMIPQNDPFYSKHNQTCSNFVRQVAAPSQTCTLGPREQTNAVSAFIDGSHIYGTDWDRMNVVRTFRDGKLVTSSLNGKPFLPWDKSDFSVVCSAPKGQHCIYGGDIRVNQQLGLTVLHLLFMREHNRIASKLKLLNPGWKDETLFQETRRIIGAQLQWITYNEFLPLALGRGLMKTFEILPSPWGFSFGYNPKIHPGIINSFSSAAFRWHTLVMNSYHLVNPLGKYTKNYKLKNIFNDPTPLFTKGNVDELLYGIVTQPSQTFDTKFVDGISNHLFPTPGNDFGADLVAINIQRGRDNGLPSYNEFRELCGLARVKGFKDLNKYFRNGSAKLFEKSYKSVDDIDLFLGGIHERPHPESIVGPVFACIVAEQFRRTKLGDRFWFENYGFIHSFTEAQINEIKKVSLSGIICENSDDIKYYPPLALVQPLEGNDMIYCTAFPRMDLRHWKSF